MHVLHDYDGEFPTWHARVHDEKRQTSNSRFEAGVSLL